MVRFIIILFLLFNSTAYATACSCSGESTVEGGLKYSDAVFKGKVLKRYTTSNYDSLSIEVKDKREAKYGLSISVNILEVQKVFKGNEIVTDTVVVYTPPNGGSCGIYFVVGEEYIVYAQQVSKMTELLWWKAKEEEKTINETTFWTHLCTRTAYWFEEEEKEILKALNK